MLEEARREERRRVNAETVLQMIARQEHYKPSLSLDRWLEKLGIIKPMKITQKHREELIRISKETSKRIRDLDRKQ